MRVSMMKKELDERGVGYRGLLEKSEFIELLVDARARGITAPSASATDDGSGGGGDGRGGREEGGGRGGEEGSASASSDSNTRGQEDGFDPTYKEVEASFFFVYLCVFSFDAPLCMPCCCSFSSSSCCF